MYDTVLVPTDGSLTAQRAVEHAVEIADRHGSRLEALYVVDTGFPNPGPGSPWTDWDEMLERLTEEGRDRLDKALEPARQASLDVHATVHEHDGVAEGILEHAEAVDADLIVMGTHGRSGVERFLLGSVAERVLRSAHVPVLLVPPRRVPE